MTIKTKTRKAAICFFCHFQTLCQNANCCGHPSQGCFARLPKQRSTHRHAWSEWFSGPSCFALRNMPLLLMRTSSGSRMPRASNRLQSFVRPRPPANPAMQSVLHWDFFIRAQGVWRYCGLPCYEGKPFKRHPFSETKTVILFVHLLLTRRPKNLIAYPTGRRASGKLHQTFFSFKKLYSFLLRIQLFTVYNFGAVAKAYEES